MKVLITGSTSSQSSQTTFSRTPTFAGLIASNLSASGAQVEFSRPYLEWDKDFLNEFDAILVGVAPLTSLSANSLYPALAVASRAEKLKKLSFFIDAPEPQKISASLASYEKGNVDLFKPFYQNRREFEKIYEEPRLMREIEVFCHRLTSADWPTTLYPWAPWITPEQVEGRLPRVPKNSLHGVSVDSYLIAKSSASRMPTKSDEPYWVYDNNKTKWFKSIQSSLKNNTVPAKEDRFSDFKSISRRVSGAVGSLVTTYRSNEAWWSPLLSTSLNNSVPVISDWRITSILGAEWNYLPASVEEMSDKERLDLALSQRSSYGKMLDSKKDTNEMIISAITK